MEYGRNSQENGASTTDADPQPNLRGSHLTSSNREI
jgi:hypothetical protein